MPTAPSQALRASDADRRVRVAPTERMVRTDILLLGTTATGQSKPIPRWLLRHVAIRLSSDSNMRISPRPIGDDTIFAVCRAMISRSSRKLRQLGGCTSSPRGQRIAANTKSAFAGHRRCGQDIQRQLKWSDRPEVTSPPNHELHFFTQSRISGSRV